MHAPIAFNATNGVICNDAHEKSRLSVHPRRDTSRILLTSNCTIISSYCVFTFALVHNAAGTLKYIGGSLFVGNSTMD